jgi:O-antigen/teichoic acid export membrane protein
MCCFVPISTTYIYGTLLTANGNLRQLNVMASCGMLMNIILNFLLIPRYEATGAAISSIITQTFTCLAQVIMVRRTFTFRSDLSAGLRLGFFMIACLMINYLSTLLTAAWMYRFILAAGGCFGLAFLLRLIDPRNLYRIVRYEEA